MQFTPALFRPAHPEPSALEGGEWAARASATPEGLYEEVASLTLHAKQVTPPAESAAGPSDPASPGPAPNLDLNRPVPPAPAGADLTVRPTDRIDIVSRQAEPPSREKVADRAPSASAEEVCETTTTAPTQPVENEIPPPPIMGMGLLGTLGSPAPEKGSEPEPDEKPVPTYPRTGGGQAIGRSVARTVTAPPRAAPAPASDPAAVLVTPEPRERNAIPAAPAQIEKAAPPNSAPQKAQPSPEATTLETKRPRQAAPSQPKPAAAEARPPSAEPAPPRPTPQPAKAIPVAARPAAPLQEAPAGPREKVAASPAAKANPPMPPPAATPRGEAVRTRAAEPPATVNRPQADAQPVAPARPALTARPAADAPGATAQEQPAPAVPRSADPIARAPQPPQPAALQESSHPVAESNQAAKQKVQSPTAQPFRVLRPAEATGPETARPVRREIPAQTQTGPSIAAEVPSSERKTNVPTQVLSAKPRIIREVGGRPAPSGPSDPPVQPATPRASAPAAEFARTDPPREAANVRIEDSASSKPPAPAQPPLGSQAGSPGPADGHTPAARRSAGTRPGRNDARRVVSENRLGSFTREPRPVASEARLEQDPANPTKETLPRGLPHRPVLEQNAQPSQRTRPAAPAPLQEASAPQRPLPSSQPMAEPAPAARPSQTETPAPASRELPAGRGLPAPLRQLVETARTIQPSREEGMIREMRVSSEREAPPETQRPSRDLRPVRDADPSSRDLRPVRDAEPLSRDLRPVRDAEPLSRDLRPVRDADPSSRDLRPVRDAEPLSRDLRPVRDAEPLSRDLRPVRDAEPSSRDLRPVRDAEPSSRDLRPVRDAEPSSRDLRPVRDADPSSRDLRPVRDLRPARADEPVRVLNRVDAPEAKPTAAPEPPAAFAPVARREEQPPVRAWWLRTPNGTNREIEAQGAVKPSPERAQAPEVTKQDFSTPADPVRPRGERGRGDRGIPSWESAARPGNEGSEGVSLWRPDTELTEEFPSRPSPQAAAAGAAQTPAQGDLPAVVTPPPSRIDSAVEVRSGTETMQALNPRAAHVAAQAAYHLRVATRGGSRETTITLDPPGLGRMRISLKENGPQLTARLTAELPEVEGLLREGAEMLRERLNRQGLAIDRIVVESAAGRSAASAQVTDQANWTSNLPSFDGLDADARRAGQQTSGREDSGSGNRPPRERGAARDETGRRDRRPTSTLALDVTA